ncbi:hypothetical protein BKH43_06995 [Helicobacter sp. 13S00401-1]|uniref:hypothetical protein n=1 Tax=Helicobacter sp. 13S00401-1 TaxID=1905758 RepID=UPI000BA79373|nr:hypothetical protein [Helicobacter sp. 13S00401-1]PAF49322.1 hypothetical protein BKH43_06995 [Helicobacter sp. 13S00401-1]
MHSRKTRLEIDSILKERLKLEDDTLGKMWGVFKKYELIWTKAITEHYDDILAKRAFPTDKFTYITKDYFLYLTKLVALSKNDHSSFKETNPVYNFLISIASIVFLFAILNGILYGAQEIYFWGDVKKAKNMASQLEGIKSEIDSLEKQGNSYGLSNSQYNHYSSLIDTYNAGVGEYNAVARNAYRRFWLLPIPLPSRGHSFN